MQPLATTALLATMAITAIHARTCGAPEWNTDYYGDDVGNFATTGDFNNMLKQCCDGCTGNSSCVAYTLANNVCYLKSGGGNRKPLNGATSVLMSRTPAPVGTCSAPESNVDYYGNDLSKQLVSGSQADQTKACCDACAKADGCNAFSLADGICYLKSSDAGRKAAPGVISAKKAGTTPTPTSTPLPITPSRHAT
ncbi:hypothetical protein SDRG_12490 [Saprolegnia diclina VS20]|uniref:Apple domain-containing protein n=1 Tax=Saprolegnia diclina (strain VS20) TaxID=1156394 RepID=T0RBY3_SAPDV|nr:hypothetical protein SDRG_12490 [Saprolegnia diclina VS20]EQC29718.1 hypothetical protein SDRG_12490 [Saprolegnia diclina VS20]|eukprot:XP_008616784.1 hypothetical protein SDRG_12490 [Saprolegnia diclina VS20]